MTPIAWIGALLLVVAASTAAASIARSASLRVEAFDPLVVRGQDFEPRERVFVRLDVRRSRMRSAVATQFGSVRVRFFVSIPGCTGFTLHAFGSRGSSARLVHRLHEACVPSPPER